MSNAREIRAKAREALQGNFLNVLLVILLANVALGVLSFVSIIIAGPLLIGVDFYLLNVIRRNEPRLEDLFHPFQFSLATSIVAYLLKMVIIFLFTLLLFIPGIIKAYQYMLVNYIIADNDKITAKEALELSKEMMQGNKLRMFYLHLSFIGWFLLIVVTFGIAALYVIPYMYTANAQFYQELKEKNTPVLEYN